MTRPLIEIGEQKRLGFFRCVQMVMISMRYRALRSLVTLATLALAVAFLMISGADNMITMRVRVHASTQLAPQQLAQRQLVRFVKPDDINDVLRSLQVGQIGQVGGVGVEAVGGVGSVGGGGGGAWSPRSSHTQVLDEYRAWLGGDIAAEQQVSLAADIAVQLQAWETWADRLSPAARAALLSDASLVSRMDQWSDSMQWERLIDRLDQWGFKLPDGEASAKHFITEDWPKFRETFVAINTGHARAIAAISDIDLAENSANPDVQKNIAAAGFVISQDQWTQINELLHWSAVRRQINEALRDTVLRARVGQVLGMKSKEVGLERVLGEIDGANIGEVLANTLAESGFSIDAQTIVALAERYQREAVLLSVLGEGQAIEIGEASNNKITLRMKLLLGLSLLVCVVGVSNAMLMAVTDRFREIATMKCIGALDGSIMGLFVIESTCLGVLASVSGVLVGLVLVVIRSTIGLGALLWETPGLASGLLLAAGLSALAGLLLAVLAAVGPAWMAARLAPMEAMRVS